MSSFIKSKRIVSALVLVLSIQLSACGYFLYPERSGQEEGKLDLTVVVLDAVGLLFFVVPGVLAYAVDIYTGTIYLPPGEKSVIDKHREKLGNLDVLNLEPVDLNDVPDINSITQMMSVYSGYDFNLSDVRVYRATESQEVMLSELSVDLKSWKRALH